MIRAISCADATGPNHLQSRLTEATFALARGWRAVPVCGAIHRTETRLC